MQFFSSKHRLSYFVQSPQVDSEGFPTKVFSVQQDFSDINKHWGMAINCVLTYEKRAKVIWQTSTSISSHFLYQIRQMAARVTKLVTHNSFGTPILGQRERSQG